MIKNNNTLVWKTVSKNINDLIPQEINPRKISDKQMSDLKKSLKKYGLVEIPAIDFDGTILAGHQRIKALQLLGLGDEIIDVRIPNRKLTEEESKQYLISSNALGGDWDYDFLKDFNFDMLLDIGFDDIELSKMFNKEKEVIDDNFNVEKELKKIVEPKTKLGDIILLGKHKILCGDSTKTENLERLFGEEKASMIYSDPVYNISVDYSGGIGGKQNYGGNVNDTRSFEEYYSFINSSLQAGLSVSEDNLHVFYWSDQVYIGLLQDIFRKNGLDNKRVCIWLKNGHNPVPSVAFNKAYEPCVYAVKNRPYLSDDLTNLNEVLNKELTTGNDLHYQVNALFDVWLAKRVSAKDYEHATTKPITLHEKAIKRCTKVNDIILDSFLGSGSTLLAGEQLGRRVYGCELEPRFCDLIIRRWEHMTGKKVRIINYEIPKN